MAKANEYHEAVKKQKCVWVANCRYLRVCGSAVI